MPRPDSRLLYVESRRAAWSGSIQEGADETLKALSASRRMGRIKNDGASTSWMRKTTVTCAVEIFALSLRGRVASLSSR